MGKHDLDHDTEHALPHRYMAYCFINVMFLWFTGGNKVTVVKFHGLRTLGAKLATDNDFDAFGAIFHDETDNTVARTVHGEATKKLVSERLRLRHCATCTIFNALGKKFDTVFWEP